MKKHNCILRGSTATGLIPLYYRSEESKNINTSFKDDFAEKAVSKIDFPFNIFKKDVFIQSVIIYRTVLIDQIIKDLLNIEKGHITIVNLGCGFDSRSERLLIADINWVEIDLPEVIKLKRVLLHENNKRQYIPASIMEDNWFIDISKKNKIIIILEGLLYYFKRTEAIWLLNLLSNQFPYATIIADYCSPFAACISRHRRKKEIINNTMLWGVRSADKIAVLCPKLRLYSTTKILQANQQLNAYMKLLCQHPLISSLYKIAIFETIYKP